MMPVSGLVHGESGYRFGVPLQEPPRRVISLVPGLTESLFDLALGDRLIGVSNDCLYPAARLAALPRLGQAAAPDVERIVALHPDFVLLDRDITNPEATEGLRSAGIHGWVVHPCTVQQAINLLWEIMEVFEEPAMVERVRWIERQMDWTVNATRVRRPVRVFAPIACDPWLTCAPGTYGCDLLRVCGGESIGGAGESGAACVPVTLDAVIRHQPEVILLPGEPFPFTPQHMAELARLDIPAARSGRIHLLDGTLLTWYGTRAAQALAELPPLLLPGAEG